MLRDRAHSLRQRSRLAIGLSWVAGYANVVVLVHSGVTSSHVTGNVTHAGQMLGEHRFAAAGAAFLLPCCFLIGAAASGLLVQTAIRARRRAVYVAPMAMQATLLGLLSIAITQTPPGAGSPAASPAAFFLICALSSAAMGMQNATITSISGAAVRTTHLTGVVTDIGTEAVTLGLWLRDRTRRGGIARWRRVLRCSVRQTSAHRLFLLCSIVGSFLLGVLIGATAFERWPGIGLLPPVLFLLGLIVSSWRALR